MRLARIGYECVAGWLSGGMSAWRGSDGDLASLSQLSPEALRSQLESDERPAVLDVRTSSEFERGHVEGAVHIPFGKTENARRTIPLTQRTAAILETRRGAAQGDVAKFGREQAVALLTPPIELRTVRAAVQAALSHDDFGDGRADANETSGVDATSAEAGRRTGSTEDSTSQSGVSRTGEYA